MMRIVMPLVFQECVYPHTPNRSFALAVLAKVRISDSSSRRGWVSAGRESLKAVGRGVQATIHVGIFISIFRNTVSISQTQLGLGVGEGRRGILLRKPVPALHVGIFIFYF